MESEKVRKTLFHIHVLSFGVPKKVKLSINFGKKVELES